MSTPATSPESPAKAQAILDAAERLFVRYGYRKSSMDDVAREAGIAKGTVYLYFAGKEALFRALLERIGQTVLAAAQQAAAAEQPLAERLYGVMHAMYGYFHAHFGDSGHLQELSEVRGSLGQDLSAQMRQAHRQIVVELLEQGVRDGDIELDARGLNAGDVAELLTAAALGAKAMHQLGDASSSYDARLRRGIDTLCAALIRAAH